MLKSIVVLLVVSGLIAGCNDVQEKDAKQSTDELSTFFENYFLETIKPYPERLTEIQWYTEKELYNFNSELNHGGDVTTKQLLVLSQEYLEGLKKHKRPTDQILANSYDVLEWNLQTALEGKSFVYHNYPFNQWDGLNVSFPRFMTETHTVTDVKTAQEYIDRLSKFSFKVNEALEAAKHREELGIIPPKLITEMTLKQVSAFVNQDETNNLLYTHFKEQLEQIKLSDEERSTLLNNVKSEITTSIYNGYTKILRYISHLDSIANDDLGLWKLPDGGAAYAHALKKNITTSMTPEEVHQLGWKEAERIKAEMTALIQEMDYKCNGYDSCMELYWTQGIKPLMDAKDPSLLYTDTSTTGRKTVTEDYAAMAKHAKKKTAHLFYDYDIPELIVKQKPVSDGYAGGYYGPPSFDNSRPGTFYIGLRRLPRKDGMENTAYHEGIPGHHYQASIQWKIENLPLFRKDFYYAAFMEGWAVYCERLCYEESVFTTNDAKFQHLWSELGRALRLIMDTGIHHKKWTIDDIFENNTKITGQGPSKSSIARYTVLPGQACGYMIGYLKIMELREFAKEQLGAQFDIKEFHDVILKNGAMPLELLEANVKKYVGTKKG
jgi:uncharacterized protein (DUF885 family)